MGIMINQENRLKCQEFNSLLAVTPTNLIQELIRYRQNNERLGRLHDLHRRLSEKLDLASMVDAISVWLSDQCAHEVVAYRHGGRCRSTISCSCHGPERRFFLEESQRLLQEAKGLSHHGPLGEEFVYHHFDLGGGEESLLILCRQQESQQKVCHALQEVLGELRGPLDRALAYEDLYDQARRDSLTGLANRRVFEETASREMANAFRYHFPLTLAVLDLDHFKAVNDYLGHATGDSVLQQVAQVMREAVRDSDHLARVGGDEFVLLMPNTREEDAVLLCQRLCSLVANLHIQAPGAPPLGVSIGLSRWHEGDGMVDWLERADAALYRAKSQGRRQAVIGS
ncbi:MAG: GGDEF domain-containing protein [Magnetococcales bacterium]|nr:GGDEF domain-containing protein [Magnetococcales bacterium]NGZ27077.1 GGDEF domain-containing protein [Magnetococcales bacterium]